MHSHAKHQLASEGCKKKTRGGCKQKTAYEIMPSLVGSEMCIRDRLTVYYYRLRDEYQKMRDFKHLAYGFFLAVGIAVSYTHLTLPTKA